MIFRVKRKRCKTCIYHPGSPLNLQILEDQVRDPKMDGFFIGYRACHHAERGSGICCRGFWDAHRDDFQLGQLGQRLNLVKFVE